MFQVGISLPRLSASPVMKKSDPIKILQVVSTLRTGGIEKLVHDLAVNIDPNRFIIEICCVRRKTGRFLAPVEASGIPVHFFGDYRRNPAGFFSQYRDLLIAGNFHGVHSHLNHLSGLFLYVPYKLGTALRIVHYHSDFKYHNHYTLKYALRKMVGFFSEKYSNKVLGISDACLDSIYGPLWKNRPKVERIYNGVDLVGISSIQPSLLKRHDLGIKDDSMVIGHVGQFRKEKNHQFLLEFAEKICTLNSEVVFLLVGDGPLLEYVRDEAVARGLGERIFFTGTRSDVPDLLGIMDLFVFPSLWEGFGLAVVEAQAAGLPVIMSTNIPDEIPLINPSVKLPLDNMTSWIDAFGLLIEHVQKNNRQEKNHPPELQKFSLNTWVRNIERIYSKACL